VSKSAADRIIGYLGPALALQQRKRYRKNTVLIVDGTLVPTRDHTIAEQSKNYRYSTNHQVVIDVGTRLVVASGRSAGGNRNDCKAWELSGAEDAVGNTTVIADGGCRGTGPVIPHRREKGQSELPEWPEWKEEHNASHRKVRARVEHVFARMKGLKILRDRRLKGDGVHHAMLGIVRPHNLEPQQCQPDQQKGGPGFPGGESGQRSASARSPKTAYRSAARGIPPALVEAQACRMAKRKHAGS